MQTTEISDGMNLHFIKAEKFKTTAVCVLIRQPLRKETVTVNSLIPHILQRGSKKYKTISEINNMTESMYGSVFEAQIIKKGEQQIIQLYLGIIRNQEHDILKQGLEFLSEIMLNPLVENKGFKKEYVEGEKENLKVAIQSRVNNKAEYAKLRCLEEMCKDEPFGIYGDGYIEDLEACTPKSIYKQYKTLLKTAPIEFIVIGDEDEKILLSQIKRIFIIDREDIEQIPDPETDYQKKEKYRVEEKSDITQGKICIGVRTGVDPVSLDFYKLLTMNEIFGGGSNSKLFINVREKESLCYYINSFVYRFKTIVLIQSGVEAENFEKVVGLVENEMEKIKNGELTEEELENAKKSLSKKFESIKDYPASTMDFYVSQHMFGDKDNIDDVIKKIRNVKKSDVIEISKRLYIDTVYTLGSTESPQESR